LLVWVLIVRNLRAKLIELDVEFIADRCELVEKLLVVADNSVRLV
jgi:hypothetical protein